MITNAYWFAVSRKPGHSGFINTKPRWRLALCLSWCHWPDQDDTHLFIAFIKLDVLLHCEVTLLLVLCKSSEQLGGGTSIFWLLPLNAKLVHILACICIFQCEKKKRLRDLLSLCWCVWSVNAFCSVWRRRLTMAISETLLHCGSLLWMNSISCKSTRTSAGRSESRRVKNVSEMNVPFMQIGQMTRMLNERVD